MADRFVLFDFDGVIADTFVLASGLAKRRCSEMSPDMYRTQFEGNIYDAIETRKAAGTEHEHGPECELDIDWWGEYEKGFKDAVPFEGIIGAIERIASSYRLAIITSARASSIRPFLKAYDLERFFPDILDVDVHTHKTKKIEMLFDKYGITAQDCVFVTDTLGDIREAAHHSMGSIACAWGFHPRETLEKGVPFRILSEPQELVDAVDDYFVTVGTVTL